MKTVAFHTLGCKVNAYESEAMMHLFENAGYQVVDFKDSSDVYVINTCTVTNTGDGKSRQMIRKAHRQNEAAAICVVGCYSQVASDEVASIEGVKVVLGTQHRHQIVSLVEKAIQEDQQIVLVEDMMRQTHFEDLQVESFKENTRAYLKIQDGCNNFCTYCIIPYARGRVRSRSKDSVLNEARSLVSHGFIELVLTGIHTAGYGQDLENYVFSDLIYDLCHEVPGLKRLRISSIEASQITPAIIDLLQNEKIIVEHLHIPIQSGCDSVLKRMNRRYTTEQYYQTIEAIREVLPDIAITTDIIAGFPQESDEEHQATYEFLKKVGYSELHVFPYSQRRGTPAAKMEGQVPPEIKKARANDLLALSKELHEIYANRHIGKTVDVIFEEVGKDGYLMGHAGNYLKVKIKGDTSLIGKISNVKIERYKAPYCFGTLLSVEESV